MEMGKKYIALSLILILGGCSTNDLSTEKLDRTKKTKVKHQTEVAFIEETTPVENFIEEEVPVEEKIGSMLMVGFMGTSAPAGSQICQDIRDYNLGGVILFDVNPVNHSQPKNISSRPQLAQLTTQLQACSRDGKLLISVDQEGGRVQRLKRKYGFYGKFPKARDVSKMNDIQVRTHYFNMARELNSVGINYNLAPVVDLAINKKNRVIYKLGRSFGSNPEDVVKYSTIFINAMRENGILSSVKHFPGHGSSLGDTHKGFVDVTNLWQEKELEPYRMLTEQGVMDTVMVAHVFNKRLDDKYPATLSSKVVKGLLRDRFGFDGVVITDDLQMGAINNKYGLRNTLKLAIGAGNDLLLFGNQLSVKSMVSTKRLVETVKSLLESGEVDMADIDRSNIRLKVLKEKI